MICRRCLEIWKDMGLPGTQTKMGAGSTKSTLVTWEGTWAVRRTGTQPVCKLFWVIIPGDSWAPYKLQTLVWELMLLWKSIQPNINPEGISWNKPMRSKAKKAFIGGVLTLNRARALVSVPWSDYPVLLIPIQGYYSNTGYQSIFFPVPIYTPGWKEALWE